MNTRIESKVVTLDGKSIHYLSAGKGPVLLCLHGWPTSALLWRNIMPHVMNGFQVVALDLPGFGKSEKRGDDSYSFKYFARIIDDLLNHLDVKRISLVVHDLGGPIGLYWAVTNKERVEKLILLNTLVYPKMSWAVKLFGMSTVLPGIRHWISSPSGIAWAIRFGVNQKDKLSDETIRNYQEPFDDRKGRKALLKSVQRLSPKGFKLIEEALPNLKWPVLIIYGEKDKILPQVKNTMERVCIDMPQAVLHALPNCGHFIQEEEPDLIGVLMRDFMNE